MYGATRSSFQIAMSSISGSPCHLLWPPFEEIHQESVEVTISRSTETPRLILI
ncbi:hypothetical protein HanOQP8_Chr17g0656271 [Helianthus annuus]|nr:hypothetical protein HanOQP8_Chr17g0656271 [Helianthus annuus]